MMQVVSEEDAAAEIEHCPVGKVCQEPCIYLRSENDQDVGWEPIPASKTHIWPTLRNYMSCRAVLVKGVRHDANAVPKDESFPKLSLTRQKECAFSGSSSFVVNASRGSITWLMVDRFELLRVD